MNVLEADDVGEDLQVAAQIAHAGRGPLVVAAAHVLTQREALAQLLADPRVASGILAAASPAFDEWPTILALERRVLSAESSYHRVSRPSGHFGLGVMEIENTGRRPAR